MSPVVRIPTDIYSRLEKHAQGFDTPANVIEKLLNHYEGINQKQPKKPSGPDTGSGPRTKYLFSGKLYGKGRLVLAVIGDYVVSNPETSYNELVKIFPKHLQGSNGVFSTQDEAEEIFQRTRHKRHFIKPSELIKLSDSVIAVSTEWGTGNIDNFISEARSVGYTITLKN